MRNVVTKSSALRKVFPLNLEEILALIHFDITIDLVLTWPAGTPALSANISWVPTAAQRYNQAEPRGGRSPQDSCFPYNSPEIQTKHRRFECFETCLVHLGQTRTY